MDLNLPTNKQYGFIAQEVEEVLPDIVRISKIPGNQNTLYNDGVSQSAKYYDLKVLSYTNIIPILVEALKEQQRQIEELKEEIKGLKRKNK
jgi:DNA-binding transcriptional ArsR family regulator